MKISAIPRFDNLHKRIAWEFDANKPPLEGGFRKKRRKTKNPTKRRIRNTRRDRGKKGTKKSRKKR